MSPMTYAGKGSGPRGLQHRISAALLRFACAALLLKSPATARFVFVPRLLNHLRELLFRRSEKPAYLLKNPGKPEPNAEGHHPSLKEGRLQKITKKDPQGPRRVPSPIVIAAGVTEEICEALSLKRANFIVTIRLMAAATSLLRRKNSRMYHDEKPSSAAPGF